MPKFLYIDSGASILDFNPYNVWDSEHLSIITDFTTFTDFNRVGTSYDLVNLGAAQNPSFNASDVDFGNKPSISFNEPFNIVQNAVADWRGSDASGFIVNINLFNNPSNTRFYFGTSDNAGTALNFTPKTLSSAIQYDLKGLSGGNNLLKTTTTALSSATPYITSLRSNGSTYKSWTNSTEQALTIVGNDNGEWLSSLSAGRDNISIGGVVKNSTFVYDGRWVFTGYFPYVSDAKCLEIITFLTNYYSI